MRVWDPPPSLSILFLGGRNRGEGVRSHFGSCFDARHLEPNIGRLPGAMLAVPQLFLPAERSARRDAGAVPGALPGAQGCEFWEPCRASSRTAPLSTTEKVGRQRWRSRDKRRGGAHKGSLTPVGMRGPIHGLSPAVCTSEPAPFWYRPRQEDCASNAGLLLCCVRQLGSLRLPGVRRPPLRLSTRRRSSSIRSMAKRRRRPSTGTSLPSVWPVSRRRSGCECPCCWRALCRHRANCKHAYLPRRLRQIRRYEIDVWAQCSHR